MFRNRKSKGGVVLETILIIAGLALFVRGLMIGSANYKFMQTAEHSEGVLGASSNFGLSHTIQFLGQTDGGGSVFVQDGLILHHQIGDHIPVVFDPQDPNHIMVDGFTTVWFKPAAFIILGLGLVGFGFRLRVNRSV